MLVLCTGMPRSASTWSFNVAKQLLARSTGKARGGYTDAIGLALERHGMVKNVVVKAHAPDTLGRALIKQGCCRTIHTYREPLDCIMSAMQSYEGSLDEQIGIAKTSLDLMRFLVETGDVLFIWYDDVIERGPEVIETIARYLGLDVSPEAREEVATILSRDNVRRMIKQLGKSAGQYKSGGADWDVDTLFSSTHMRDNPSDPTRVFSAAQITMIAQKLGDHVDATATLRPEIRAIGRLGAAPPTSWPEPLPPPPTVEPVEAEPAEAPPVEATPAVEATPVPSPAAAAPAVAAVAKPAPAAVAPAADQPPDVRAANDDESPEAPSADAEPPEAPSADLPETAPAAAAVSATAAPAGAPTPPAGKPAAAPPTARAPAAAKTAAPAATPRKPAPVAYDPRRDAARRALARDLLGSLGRLPAKPRPPVNDD